RYRLPVAALLALPAGIGLARLCAPGLPRARRAAGIGLALGCSVASLLLSSRSLEALELASALANRAESWRASHRPELAERDARAAVAIDPSLGKAWYILGVVLEHEGRTAEAERAYGTALERQPGSAEAAANLAALWLGRGEAEQAIPVLRRALLERSRDPACWTNLIVALVQTGRAAEAAAAVHSARAAGVALDPGLIEAVE
ncbi:MAG TPA: tetratricopeptide repeat protein, partial [Candidatus Polarisedimenticolaceae bacterium]|nr:tetratricopeptide repeat protein [Candidatus Polarisedimenticolaceae bacterium]